MVPYACPGGSAPPSFFGRTEANYQLSIIFAALPRREELGDPQTP